MRYYSQIIYIISLAIAKLSILLTYLRIFTIGKIRIVIKIVMAIVAAIAFATCIAIIFHCIPVRGNFYQSNFPVPGDKCINTWSLQYIMTSLIITTDLVVLILPIKKIWSMYLFLYNADHKNPRFRNKAD